MITYHVDLFSVSSCRQAQAVEFISTDINSVVQQSSYQTDKRNSSNDGTGYHPSICMNTDTTLKESFNWEKELCVQSHLRFTPGPSVGEMGFPPSSVLWSASEDNPNVDDILTRNDFLHVPDLKLNCGGGSLTLGVTACKASFL